MGNILSTLAHEKMSAGGSSGLANIARFAIGSVAVAAALAFGLGGKDAAKSLADNWAARITGS